ncbi:MAG TPA: DUF2207 domain-containing protein [Actinophytocola sp.]|jgi:hypothetical protein|uniref:DUF2207 domain-containing protein n=1 Tax=Actinophytocola sp. TaxID=1872138 RepID=UPI002F92EBB0
MAKFGVLCVCVALAGSAVSPGVAQGAPEDERMLSYVVRAELDADGMLSVTEEITYDFGASGDGAIRMLPRWYSPAARDAPPDVVRTVDVDQASAALDGRPVAVARERPSPAKIVLRVGESGERITGEHDVHLQYRIGGLVTKRDGVPVLEWDLADTSENVPIDHADVTVTVPGQVGDADCLTGYGVTGRGGNRCTTTESSGSTAHFAVDRISSYDRMRTSVELPGNVAVPREKTEVMPDLSNGEVERASGGSFSWFTLVLLVVFAGGAIRFGGSLLRRRS